MLWQVFAMLEIPIPCISAWLVTTLSIPFNGVSSNLSLPWWTASFQIWESSSPTHCHLHCIKLQAKKPKQNFTRKDLWSSFAWIKYLVGTGIFTWKGYTNLVYRHTICCWTAYSMGRRALWLHQTSVWHLETQYPHFKTGSAEKGKGRWTNFKRYPGFAQEKH